MAGVFTIYVEGITDEKFIRDYFEHLFGIKLPAGSKVGGIINTESKDKLALRAVELLSTIDQGGINLIIFDADGPKNQGGLTVRQAEIAATIKKVEGVVKSAIKYDVFLFPDNKGDGSLEELLESIINPAHKQIFDCWADYETCLKKKDPTYTVPAKKSKISSYVEVLSGESHREKNLIAPQVRNYLVTKHWDLTSASLQPLKDFLTKYCK